MTVRCPGCDLPLDEDTIIKWRDAIMRDRRESGKTKEELERKRQEKSEKTSESAKARWNKANT